MIPHQHPYGMGKYGNGHGIYSATICAKLASAAEKHSSIPREYYFNESYTFLGFGLGLRIDKEPAIETHSSTSFL